MSFQAMSWACDQELPCNQKMVLMMLANRTNHDTGQCNPSHNRLAKDCGMSQATLKRCIKVLEEKSMLTVIHRRDGDVSLPNQYKLHLHGVGSQRAEGRVTENPGSGHSEPGVGSQGATNQEVNQEVNQKVNQVGKSPDDEPAKPKKKRACQMPADFLPKESHREKANKNGIDLAHEVEQFTNYHLAKGSTFVDWDRALHTWLGNAMKFARQNGKNPPPRNGFAGTDYRQGLKQDENGRYRL